MKRALPFLIIIAGLLAGLSIAWYLKHSAAEVHRPTSPAATSVPGPAPPVGPVRLGADPAHTLGNTDAPVMLEEFGDFECSSCASLHPALKMMKGEFGARLVIVFREFPLTSVHPHALVAAQAAEAAGRQGKFWEMHDLLFENQRAWHEASDVMPIFEQYASQLGLGLEQFKRDITGEAVQQRIRLDGERGRWIGVTGTPTVFLNGREVPFDSLAPERLRTLIGAQVNSH